MKVENAEVTWTSVNNTVSKRLVNDSLSHTFHEISRISKKTKIVNSELKRHAGLQTYSQYVKFKTKILKKIATEDEDSDFEPSVRRNHSYYKDLSFTHSSDNEEKIDIQDENSDSNNDSSQEKNSCKKKRPKNRNLETPSSRSSNLDTNKVSKTSRESPVRKLKSSQSKLTGFFKRKTGSGDEESCPKDKKSNAEKKASSLNESRFDSQEISEPTNTSTINKHKMVTIRPRNKTREDVKKNLSSIIGNFGPGKVSEENFDRNESHNESEFNLSNVKVVAQSTQYPDDSSDFSDKTENKNLTKLDKRQPKDSGIDSCEELTKIKTREKELKKDEESLSKQKEELQLSNDDDFHSPDTEDSNDSDETLHVERNKTPVVENEPMDCSETVENNDSREKNAVKIIGTEIVNKKYKILDKKQGKSKKEEKEEKLPDEKKMEEGEKEVLSDSENFNLCEERRIETDSEENFGETEKSSIEKIIKDLDSDEDKTMTEEFVHKNEKDDCDNRKNEKDFSEKGESETDAENKIKRFVIDKKANKEIDAKKALKKKKIVTKDSEEETRNDQESGQEEKVDEQEIDKHEKNVEKDVQSVEKNRKAQEAKSSEKETKSPEKDEKKSPEKDEETSFSESDIVTKTPEKKRKLSIEKIKFLTELRRLSAENKKSSENNTKTKSSVDERKESEEEKLSLEKEKESPEKRKLLIEKNKSSPEKSENTKGDKRKLSSGEISKKHINVENDSPGSDSSENNTLFVDETNRSESSDDEEEKDFTQTSAIFSTQSSSIFGHEDFEFENRSRKVLTQFVERENSVSGDEKQNEEIRLTLENDEQEGNNINLDDDKITIVEHKIEVSEDFQTHQNPVEMDQDSENEEMNQKNSEDEKSMSAEAMNRINKAKRLNLFTKPNESSSSDDEEKVTTKSKNQNVAKSISSDSEDSEERNYVNLDDSKITIDEHKIEIPENLQTNQKNAKTGQKNTENEEMKQKDSEDEEIDQKDAEDEEIMSAQSLKRINKTKRLNLFTGPNESSSSDEEVKVTPKSKNQNVAKSISSDSEDTEEEKNSFKEKNTNKTKSPKKKNAKKNVESPKKEKTKLNDTLKSKSEKIALSDNDLDPETEDKKNIPEKSKKKKSKEKDTFLEDRESMDEKLSMKQKKISKDSQKVSDELELQNTEDENSKKKEKRKKKSKKSPKKDLDLSNNDLEDESKKGNSNQDSFMTKISFQEYQKSEEENESKNKASSARENESKNKESSEKENESKNKESSARENESKNKESSARENESKNKESSEREHESKNKQSSEGESESKNEKRSKETESKKKKSKKSVENQLEEWNSKKSEEGIINEDSDFRNYVEDGIDYFQHTEVDVTLENKKKKSKKDKNEREKTKEGNEVSSASQIIEEVPTQSMESSQIISEIDTQDPVDNESRKTNKNVEDESLNYALSNIKKKTNRYDEIVDQSKDNNLNKSEDAEEDWKLMSQLSDLIEKEDLVELNLPSSVTVNDILDSEAVWLFEIPKKEMSTDLIGKKLSFDGTNLKLDNSDYQTSCKNLSSVTCVVSSKKSKTSYKAVHIRPICSVLVRSKNAVKSPREKDISSKKKQKATSIVNTSSSDINEQLHSDQVSEKELENRKKLKKKKKHISSPSCSKNNKSDHEFKTPLNIEKKSAKKRRMSLPLSDSDEDSKSDSKRDIKRKKLVNVDGFLLDEKPPITPKFDTNQGRSFDSDSSEIIDDETKPKKEKREKMKNCQLNIKRNNFKMSPKKEKEKILKSPVFSKTVNKNEKHLGESKEKLKQNKEDVSDSDRINKWKNDILKRKEENSTEAHKIMKKKIKKSCDKVKTFSGDFQLKKKEDSDSSISDFETKYVKKLKKKNRSFSLENSLDKKDIVPKEEKHKKKEKKLVNFEH